MKNHLLNTLCITLLSYAAFAQTHATDQWKKAVVKIESVQQRYNPEQVDGFLKKKLDSIGHVISQHETADIRGEISGIRDTLRGTGVLIADGSKIYLVTAKHLIKATELSNGAETITDQLTIAADASGKKTNEIPLLSLTTGLTRYKPFVLSSDKEDLVIISFQKNDYKTNLVYMKQVGVVAVPIQAIAQMNGSEVSGDVFTVGFPTISGSKKAQVSNGKIVSANKQASNFKVDMAVYPGNSGGPVIKNDKLIGILSYQAGIITNIDAALHPFAKANSATAIKASVILPLLKKLQENEKNPTFNR